MTVHNSVSSATVGATMGLRTVELDLEQVMVGERLRTESRTLRTAALLVVPGSVSAGTVEGPRIALGANTRRAACEQRESSMFAFSNQGVPVARELGAAT
jgi:hypothetical protein